MKKYRELWYELKHSEDLIEFCFYDTEDKLKKGWCFNAEVYTIKNAYACIDAYNSGVKEGRHKK